MLLGLLGMFLLGSFLVTYCIIPKIIKVVFHKKLLDEPNIRSSHKRVTPTLGGVAFFITIILSFFFLKKWDEDIISLNLMVSLTVLFIIGLKDDLVALSATTKSIAQILAITFLVCDNNLLIESLGGFLGITELNYWFYLFFIYFSIFFIINSFNLIDGIDGLASSVGITIFTFFAVIFYFLEQNYYFFLCMVIVGTLLAFLTYNLSEKKKIFMGDTGSMIIGFLIAVLALKILSYQKEIGSIGVLPENLPIIITSIISIPILDTIRVFIIRTVNKKSFFIADRNHVHHIFIDRGFTHKKTTFFIVIINMIITLIIYLLSMRFNSFILLLFFVLLSMVFYLAIFYLLKKNESNDLKKKR
ncbi:undecaprenyl/decaprenyl-phosphate alpha-N-acetylglucosaminyl 1-phosphate transferase [Tenacibaculum mesophilum]|uniref:Undecaprenyl/decaprenyl-phosphate alpha-N-acetylglucosaminyl 1-phosphate transferase n=1 Tax=Tenacibaculum mesophilum TaxID=104268 RepID=A0AAE9MPC2_9FLAO|nr:MraY family glycosyltransferase [Tenacibaculum mesophilum]KAF9658583.1 undecaprenyl/decaprenyl-phosphate alpha-N-acetylglucosaminyl 1-phosphate transferase [Tenacibaculum mesophilum]UTD15145.1 undecaprenyl/decaprenyl-phosphate alpha-N-acetylglucosaminyl 1-phosphate transferase [Tenacibaculum mesophilum]GFD96235.1 undecaprenyl-phosphate alpha-N-acetylglucosaminyl 1-phosphate transferase [Alteromonas sp. KUL154]GFE00112.1 undecaprenyl-phosphate alpha-N-acetylglucosaminyl 1-phosphate transferas